MQLDSFLVHLDDFYQQFNIDVTTEGRKNKLLEEVWEFVEAHDFKAPQDADDESIDVLVCAIANCKARGINNMLHAAFLKLERTAEKYRRENHEQLKRPTTATG